jgi:hypothetical protein
MKHFLPSKLSHLEQTFFKKALSFSFFLLFSACLMAQVRYVKPTASGAGTGADWANASGDLQAMINASAPGDQIWVAAGVYKPQYSSTDAVSADTRDWAFKLSNGVEIYGGFNGTEGTLGMRNITANPTIMSGDVAGNDSGFSNNSDNSYHLFVSVGLTTPAVIDGFTISGANGDSPATVFNFYNGALISAGSGAVIINSGDLHVRNTTFTSNNTSCIQNTAGADVEILFCTFDGNRSVNYGTGIWNYGSNPTITGCTFNANQCTGFGYGAGIYNQFNSDATVSDCIFTNNTAPGGNGCAIRNENSAATVVECTFIGNSSGNRSGAIYNMSRNGNNLLSPTVSNCTFHNNSASQGGGITNQDCSPVITNCTFTSNTAGDGGGIFNIGLRPGTQIINCTFNGNTSNAVYTWGAPRPTLTNCIIWGTNPIVDGNGTGTVVQYSIVQGGFTGTGNSSADPLFFNASDPNGTDNIWRTADDGISIQSTSPAINAGTSTGAPTTDITAALRTGNPDMGAYEYAAPACLTPTGLTSSPVSTTSQSVSWTCAGCPGTFNVEYGPAGFTLGTGTVIANATNPQVITGLTAATNYQFYVTQNCGGSASTAASFTTLAVAPTANTNICQAIPFQRVDLSKYGIGASTITCSSIIGNTTNALSQAANSCGTTSSKTLWYTFTTPACFEASNLAAFNLKFSTRNPGTAYDTRLAIFTSSNNTCSGTMSLVACNNDAGMAGPQGCVGSSASGSHSSLVWENAAFTASSEAGSGVLAPNTTYWVRVSGADAAAEGAFELTLSVVADAPVLTNSSTNPTGVIDATWTDVNAASYRLSWRPVGGTGYATRYTTANSFSTNAGAMLMPNTTYEYWVNNWCGATLETSFASPIATLATPAPSAGCSVPVATCGTSTPTNIMLNWPEITGASRIGVRSTFAGQTGYTQLSSIAYTTTGGISSFNFTGLQTNMAYTFTLFVECDGRIFWSTPVVCSTGNALPRLAADVHSFEYDGTEFVDVRMTDFGFFEPAAGLPDHIVDISTGKLEVTFMETVSGNAVRFALNPNVTSDLSTMTIFTAQPTDANINIFDMNGALVQSMSMGQVSNGQQVSIETSKMAAGVYFVNLRTGNTTTTEKLVIVR